MKKATGIVRMVDALRRLTLPVEVCRPLGIGPGDPIEIYVDGDMICVKKHKPAEDVAWMLNDIKRGIEMNSGMLPPDKVEKLMGKLDEMADIITEFGFEEV